ncbi:replication-relaxation family protein [Actinokineospora sp. HUAS TT18]|uniref:replication-relaxation family protein n=1 Tax=Actinokineospora sp. HUAS TT18 TaxID=3447451 RepID=UPI003F51FEA1
MSNEKVADLLMSLSDRDRAVLDSLRAHRLLTTELLRRLHFLHHPPSAFDRRTHATEGAAAVATMRVLARLEGRGLVTRLKRRIGGVRAGSGGITWQLGSTGERLLRVIHGDEHRRRYLEPTALFTDHTLAVAEAAVQIGELDHTDGLELVALETEPTCWRSFLSPHGTRSWLKPDLFAVTASGNYEDHWFIEVDRSTEHPGVVQRKAAVYQRYAASGDHQAKHGLFPAVLWVVPDDSRKRTLATAISADQSVQGELFNVITTGEFVEYLTGNGAGHPEPVNKSDSPHSPIAEIGKSGRPPGRPID